MTLKPGILSDRAIGALFGGGQLKSEVMLDKDQIQPASLDLRLGGKAIRVRASFMPGRGHTVADKLERLTLHEIDLENGAVLETGCVYIVPLLETLALPATIAASTNPKSSTGRLDIFTRVIFGLRISLLLALVVYRIGAHIPVPGIDPAQLQALFDLFEKHLNVPPATIQIAHRLRTPIEVVSDEGHQTHLTIHLYPSLHPPQDHAVVFVLERDALILDDLRIALGEIFDHSVFHIILGPRDPRDFPLIQVCQMGKVHIRLVKHHNFPW